MFLVVVVNVVFIINLVVSVGNIAVVVAGFSSHLSSFNSVELRMKFFLQIQPTGEHSVLSFSMQLWQFIGFSTSIKYV